MLANLTGVGFYGTVSKFMKRKKKGSCLAFTSSTKREIAQFHVVVEQRRRGNVQKSVMHVQSCCFVNLNLLLFLPFSWPSPSLLLKLPVNSRDARLLLPLYRSGVHDFCKNTRYFVDYEQSPFFLRDSRASERRARLKITPREKRLPAACRLFSRGAIFTRARVSLALLSQRKNGDFS